MVGHGVAFVKNLLKSSLDSYILPGTCAGTEILWLYIIQWKRRLVLSRLAIVYLIESSCALQRWQRLIPIYRRASNSDE